MWLIYIYTYNCVEKRPARQNPGSKCNAYAAPATYTAVVFTILYSSMCTLVHHTYINIYYKRAFGRLHIRIHSIHACIYIWNIRSFDIFPILFDGIWHTPNYYPPTFIGTHTSIGNRDLGVYLFRICMSGYILRICVFSVCWMNSPWILLSFLCKNMKIVYLHRSTYLLYIRSVG